MSFVYQGHRVKVKVTGAKMRMTFSVRIAAWMHQSLKSASVESGALRPFQEQQQQQQRFCLLSVRGQTLLLTYLVYRDVRT